MKIDGVEIKEVTHVTEEKIRTLLHIVFGITAGDYEWEKNKDTSIQRHRYLWQQALKKPGVKVTVEVSKITESEYLASQHKP